MTINEVLVPEASTRDPLRVPHAMSALASYWTKHPDRTIGGIVAEVGNAFAQNPADLEDEVFFDHLKLSVGKRKEGADVPKIVYDILSALDAYWMQNQDLRLGEILDGAAKENNVTIGDLENEEFLSYLQTHHASWE